MSFKNVFALFRNLIEHSLIFLFQKSKRKITFNGPIKSFPVSPDFKPLPLIPSGKTIFIVGQAVEPAVSRSMKDYTDAMGMPGGYSFYIILTGDVERLKRELSTTSTFLNNYPGTTLLLAVGYGHNLMGNIHESLLLLQGRFDEELTYLCNWIKSVDRAIFLRPLYEFDRLGLTYGGPDLYIKAYKYITDHIRSFEINNLSMVWHSAGPMWRQTDSSTKYGIASTLNPSGKYIDRYVSKYFEKPVIDNIPIKDFFPGKEYVDYFAISYWDGMWGRGPFSPAGHKVYMAEVDRLFSEAKELGVKLAIAESTPAYVGTFSGVKSENWLNDYFDILEKYDISFVAYQAAEFLDEGGVWGNIVFNEFWSKDARIHSHSAIKNLFNKRIANKRYLLQKNESVNKAIGFTPKPVSLTTKVNPEPIRNKVTWPHSKGNDLPGWGGWSLPKL